MVMSGILWRVFVIFLYVFCVNCFLLIIFIDVGVCDKSCLKFDVVMVMFLILLVLDVCVYILWENKEYSEMVRNVGLKVIFNCLICKD